MSTARRGATPLTSGPPSLEAANQAQIEDLVQRNRTLEHTNKKLADQLALEVTRSKDAVAHMQEQWHDNQREWREGCDELLSCHRLVQQQTIIELQKERASVLREQELLRREKLLRLQRDYQILKFQAREAELEDRISSQEEETDNLEAAYQKSLKILKDKCVEYAKRAKGKEREAKVAHRRAEELEEGFDKLREEHAQTQAAADVMASKYERVSLQLDGAQTKCEELTRTNDELKRTNSDLKRQLEKWQNLETKGGEEAAAQRKKRVELELQVKELKEELERKNTEESEALSKEKRRVEKMKETVAVWKEHVEEMEQKATEAAKEAEDAIKQHNKSLKAIEKLKKELELERSRVRPPSPQKNQFISPEIEEEDEVVNEIAEPDPPSPQKSKSKPKAKPKSKQTPTTVITEFASDDGSSRPAKRKGKAKVASADSDIEEIDERPPKPKPKVRKQPTAESEVEVEEVGDSQPSKKGTGKGKAKATDDEIEQVREPPPRNKGKRKAREEDETDIEVSSQPPPAKKRAGSVTSVAKSRRGKGSDSRAGSVLPTTIAEEEADNTEATAAPKNKKRKINIFPSQGQSPNFNFTTQFGDTGLDIPSMLSPLKESEPVPPRSVTGSIVNMLRDRITGRR